MIENVYEVEREDYKGFLDQINKDAKIIKEEQNEGIKWTKIYSKTNNKLLCTKETFFTDDRFGEEHYYIFEMPPIEDRVPPPKVKKIQLETEEEVKAFFNIINAAINKEKKDGTI